MESPPETYDAVSQHDKFHTHNARSYDWRSQNKGAYTCPGSCLKGYERPTRICRWTSSFIALRLIIRWALTGIHQVSCVCVSLYACENAFRSRQPLPQFLPSARHARTALVSHIAQSMRQSKRVLGLSHLYGFAEGEVLEDLVDTLERLLGISRTLFGTAEWLIEESAPEVGPHPDSVVRHEWHSVQ